MLLDHVFRRVFLESPDGPFRTGGAAGCVGSPSRRWFNKKHIQMSWRRSEASDFAKSTAGDLLWDASYSQKQLVAGQKIHLGRQWGRAAWKSAAMADEVETHWWLGIEFIYTCIYVWMYAVYIIIYIRMYIYIILRYQIIIRYTWTSK